VLDITAGQPGYRMDDDDLVCSCGARYTSEPHFTRHQNSCAAVISTSRLSWAVADKRKKKRRNDAPVYASGTSAASSSGMRATKRSRTDLRATISSSYNRYASLSPSIEPTVVRIPQSSII
jgi:hypothetical protein